MKKILLVDDDMYMIKLIETYVGTGEYDCSHAKNGDDAVEKVKNGNFDIVVMDVVMPVKDGFQALSEIRTFSEVPVIIISSKDSEQDKLKAFSLGADDYVVKPFSPKELVARINAMVKRNKINLVKNQVYGDIEINIPAREVYVDGAEINLTPKEFELLVCLSQNYKQVMNRDQLMVKVWGYDYFGDARTVDTHIKSLRERLGHCRDYIKTIWGVGYKFEVPASYQKKE